METEIFTITLPPWAKGNADGDYTKVGALLPTRNGNFVGNAVLVSVLGGNNLSYQIITDAGNKTTMTLDELKECFHPPMYIVDINDCPAFWAYRHKNNIGDANEDINSKLLKSLEETRLLLSLVTFLSRKLVNHPDKESINGINEVLKRARETCEEAKRSINA